MKNFYVLVPARINVKATNKDEAVELLRILKSQSDLVTFSVDVNQIDFDNISEVSENHD